MLKCIIQNGVLFILFVKTPIKTKIPDFPCLVGRQGFASSAKGGRAAGDRVIPANAGIFLLIKARNWT
jgi:hypothetical protein